MLDVLGEYKPKLASSNVKHDYDNVKNQLAKARRELLPEEITELDDAIAAHFDPQENLRVELGQICRLVAAASADELREADPWASGPSTREPSQIEVALLRLDELLTKTGVPPAHWHHLVIPALKLARLDLSDEALGRLPQSNGICTEDSSAPQAQPDHADMAFFLNALAEASDVDARLRTGEAQQRIGDVANMVRSSRGDHPAKSTLVQDKFGALAGLVRSTFNSQAQTLSEGLPLESTAHELNQLLWLDDVLREVEIPDTASGDKRRELEQRDGLLTKAEREQVSIWQRALEAGPAAKSRADGLEVIEHEVGDIRQRRPNACGDACLQTILRYHGGKHLEFGTNSRWIKTGLDHAQLRGTLKEQGIESMFLVPYQFRQASASDLRLWLAHHGPLLAVTSDHYVIITGIEGDTVRIHCPLLGAREASVADLNRYVDWSVTPSPIEATYRVGSPSKRLTRKWKPVSQLLTRVFVARPERKATPEWRSVNAAKRSKD